jgi:hypothetical protein
VTLVTDREIIGRGLGYINLEAVISRHDTAIHTAVGSLSTGTVTSPAAETSLLWQSVQ